MPEEYEHDPIQTLPELEAQNRKPSFWQRNGATIITLAILGLIIGGAIAVNERRGSDELALDDTNIVLEDGEQDNDVVISEPSQPDPQPEAPAPQPEEPKQEQPKQEEPKKAEGQITTASNSVVETSGNNMTVTAERGDGRTHLARKAITEELRKSNIDLSEEQRVYAEDYLQKKYASQDNLHPGSTITFSAEDISESISASQSLNSAQIQNLHQYSVLVNWPPI